MTQKNVPYSIPSTLTFVDVETTGGSPHTDRITEIGIVRVEKGKKVSEFQSLVNPQVHIPHYIQHLTGINQEMVKNAPYFEDIKQTVREHLDGAVFVAHNVTFDYSFVRGEFKRSFDSYQSKLLCTVRLSRALYPEFRRHSLSNLISRFGLSVENRHRAFDDAHALWEFFLKAQEQTEPNLFNRTVESIIKGPRLPANLKKNGIGPFADTSGVYTFIGDSDETGFPQKLYIGKSTSLQKRIYSHFTIGSQSKTDITLSRFTKDITTISTAGNFSAVLLEAHMIKSEKPLLNKALTKEGMYSYLIKSEINGYFTYESVRGIPPVPTSQIEILSAYTSDRSQKESLAALCDENTLCPTLMKLTPTTYPCFSYQVEKCLGACIGLEKPLSYNQRFMASFADTKVSEWPFSGAVMFTENSDDIIEHHIFDAWCHLGTIRVDKATESKETTRYPKAFDWDIYKIIKKIVSIKSRSLKQLSETDIKNYLDSGESSTCSM